MSVKIILLLMFVQQCSMLVASNHVADKSGLLQSLRKHMAKKVRPLATVHKASMLEYA